MTSLLNNLDIEQQQQQQQQQQQKRKEHFSPGTAVRMAELVKMV